MQILCCAVELWNTLIEQNDYIQDLASKLTKKYSYNFSLKGRHSKLFTNDHPLILVFDEQTDVSKLSKKIFNNEY